MQQKWWAVLFGVVNLAALLLFAVAPFCGWWLPPDVSTFGWEVDLLFYLILAITGFFFVLVEGLLVWALWRYAAESGRKALYVHGNHKLELLWTFVPAAILLFIAFAQVRAWEHIKYVSHMPEPTQLIELSARQFEWRFRYPTDEQLQRMTVHDGDTQEQKAAAHAEAAAWGEQERKPGELTKGPQFDDIHLVNELHTWKGAKVRLALHTQDVIHSFFLPSMRLKQDALPGKTIPVWFEAKDYNIEWNESQDKWTGPDGKDPVWWELACAELCGWGHYRMQGRLWVHKDKADFDRWLNEAAAKQSYPLKPGQK